MGHTAEGVLRRLLDEPDGVTSADRAHAASCAVCRATLETMRADADAIGAALDGPVPLTDADVDAAWSRLSAAEPQVGGTFPVAGTLRALPGGRSRTTAPVGGRSWRAVRRPVVAAVAAVAVLGGAGAAAAGGWLPIFRTEKVAPVAVNAKDLLALPNLAAYGDVDVVTEPNVHAVADTAAAAKETGLDVPEVADLPKGVKGAPDLQVGGRTEGVFTFSSARAAGALGAGQTLPPVPAGVEGSKVRLAAGPGVASVWQSGSGVPALVVARAKAPTAESTGVPFDTIRDYMLSLPGLPEGLASQLRSFTADGTTLPLPFPADKVTSSEVTVDGSAATLLQTKDKAMAAVVWVSDGVVTVVAGSLDDDEVLDVARGLR